MIQYSNHYKYACADGINFTRDDHTGYYLSSKPINGKRRKRLHVYIWEKVNGLVPNGFDIHHKDGNKYNNEPSNLAMLSRSEHRTEHYHMMTDEQREQIRKHLNEKARPKASEWHGSPVGIEWHRKHGSKIMNNRPYVKHICENCGKEFESKRIYKETEHKFCSNNCKSAFRRKSGVDNEIRYCLCCGKEFTANKYSKAKYCENCTNKKNHRKVSSV